MTDEATPQALSMAFAKHVDLVEFAGKVWLVRVCVRLPFGKANQVAVRVFDDKAEPASVHGLE